jgi:RNA polymerase sigma factor (TIGR02999 family)
MKQPPSKSTPTQRQPRGVDTLFALVHDKLRRVASTKLRGERHDHTLQPTDVVHEAYVRLKRTDKRWESETEFRKYAAPVIRHVLVDHARSRPPNERVMVTSWDDMDAADGHNPDVAVLALHEALDRLEKRDPGLVRIIELRYFGGLTEQETAEAVSIPLGTLKNRLTFARTWLHRELTKPSKR